MNQERDPFGVVLALIFLAGGFAGLAAVVAAEGSAWWLVLAFPLLFFGLVGLGVEFTRPKR